MSLTKPCDLTVEVLRQHLRYDRDTGLFTWLSGRHRGSAAGQTFRHGYIGISFKHRHYGAHRLAWLDQTGALPEGILDHKDGNPSNNRLANLRLATTSTNGANRKLNVNNASGFKGVSLYRRSGRWQAAITYQGKYNYLGLFDTPEEAHASYVEAAKRLFGEFARAA